jgi:hypothetical protein
MANEVKIILVTKQEGQNDNLFDRNFVQETNRDADEFVGRYHAKINREIKDEALDSPFKGIINGIVISMAFPYASDSCRIVKRAIYPSLGSEIAEDKYETLIKNNKRFGGRLIQVIIFGPEKANP